MTIVAAGAVFLVIVAVIVGIVDAASASTWRQIAAERRERWEARRREFHGVDAQDVDSWDDD